MRWSTRLPEVKTRKGNSGKKVQKTINGLYEKSL